MVDNTALVLSGGGMRGAYEAGVVAGIVEVLDGRAAPFSTFTGTSVGAINAAFLASQADRPDLGVQRLCELWTQLSIDRHVDIDLSALVPWPGRLGRWLRRGNGERLGWSVLDPRPLERMVDAGMDWSRLRHNVDAGVVRAFAVAALDIASGRTTVFAELAPGVQLRPTRDARRVVEIGPLSTNHLLASSAIPLLFPARRIGDSYYVDGGLRFNTPIAPALRSGAERLVVVTTLFEGRRDPRREAGRIRDYPGFSMMVGKLLNALLADPVAYDLQILDRFNRLIALLEHTLEPDELDRFRAVTAEVRGVPYRRLDTLVFKPSENLGALASDYFDNHLRSSLSGLEGHLIRRALTSNHAREADWASYVLFDGGFARTLVDLGRRDALSRTGEIRTFFQ